MRRLAWAVCGLVLALGAGAPARADAVGRFTEGSWQGGGIINDATNHFDGCYADAPYKNGTVLAVMVYPNYKWVLAFQRATYFFRTDQDVKVAIRFDGGDWWPATARAVRQDLIAIDMGSEAKFVDLFRRSVRLDLDDGADLVPFRLDGTDRMMYRLGECVRQQLALGPRPPATGSAAGAPPSSGSAPALAAAPPTAGAAPAAGGRPGAPPGPADNGGGREGKKAGATYGGTGIIVTAAGHVVTNAHVVDQCKTITVQQQGSPPVEAQTIVADMVNDLALVKSKQTYVDKDVARIASGPAVAGESIAVYGFPLSDTLSATGNIVAGNVSALAGSSNDINLLQITAPVQPGNSGGPLLNYKGGVAGVVSARIDDFAVLGRTGAVPQNVNFAIKSSVLSNFLDVHSVDFLTLDAGAPQVDLPAIADAAKNFTVKIICKT